MTAQLCSICEPRAQRASAILCENCAKLFRVLVVPNDLRSWEEVERESESGEGTAMDTFFNALLTRINNQRRELAKLNEELRRAHHGVKT